MSQALCLVDRAMHAGSFRCMPYERCLYRVFSTSFSCGRGIVPCSPSLCTVRFSFSPASGWLLTLMPRPSYRTPSLSFLSSFGDTTACTPASSSAPLISSPLFPIRSLVQGAHHSRVYPHSMNHLCIPSTPPPLQVCCAPPPFASIKYPWSLLFFFFIPSPRIQSRATRSSRPSWN